MTTLSEHRPAVLDTNVVSILFDRKDSDIFRFYDESLVGYRLSISFQTLEEARFGAYLRSWGVRRVRELQDYLRRFDVVWPNPDIVDACARIRSETRKTGRELSLADAWIAATAITLGCPLASDDRDFNDVPELALIQRPR